MIIWVKELKENKNKSIRICTNWDKNSKNYFENTLTVSRRVIDVLLNLIDITHLYLIFFKLFLFDVC